MLLNLSRRDFLKGTAGAGGLVIGVQMGASQFLTSPAEAAHHGLEANLFVTIASDGSVTITCARVEMGQGVRTTLPMIVADELEADIDRCSVVQADADQKWGDFGQELDTDGSRSVRRDFQHLREAGAGARMMLEQAAADMWGVPVGEVTAQNHAVSHAPSGRSAGFGELADAAASLSAPAKEDIRLKDRSDWKYIGNESAFTPDRYVDLVAMTTGQAGYAADVLLPGMKTAVIQRAPVYRATLKSVDDSGAKAVAGVSDVIEIPQPELPIAVKPLGGIAVIADNTWAALKGRKALKIEWDDGANAVHDSSSYNAKLVKSSQGAGTVLRDKGNVDAVFNYAGQTVERDYFVPYYIHTPMEPPAAVADFKDGKCEIWTSAQHPYWVRDTVAEFLGIDKENVTVHITLLGGGFGRKSKPDFAVEAAYLSQKIGAPVRVIWTREDEIQNGYYHAAAAQNIKAAIVNNKVAAWRHGVAFPSILGLWVPEQKIGFNIEHGLGLVDFPYDSIPNIRIENGDADLHIRVGWYRAVNNIQHAFAINSFVNELAHELGRDPLEFQLELIGPPTHIDMAAEGVVDPWNYGEDLDKYPVDTGRLANVLRTVAKKAGYGKAMPKGHGLGIAVHRAFVSYIATAVHVAVADDGTYTIPRVDVCLDCGTGANPERIRAQAEGAQVYANTIARWGEITLTKGAVDQSNFHDYPVSRMSDSPLNVHLHRIESDAIPSGVGEPMVPPFAPALANAIFQATGKRLRNLPIRPEDILNA
jgi:isoquinoline 1-oxidoreductase beta subunit